MQDIKLDGSIGFFSVNEIGSVTQETFAGEFAVKCILSPLDQIKANKLYRDLIGETSPHLVPENIGALALALSQLKYRIIKAPAGWKHDEIDGGHLDANIVTEVLNRAVECQVKFQQEAKKRLEGLQAKLTEQYNNGEFTPKKDKLDIT